MQVDFFKSFCYVYGFIKIIMIYINNKYVFNIKAQESKYTFLSFN